MLRNYIDRDRNYLENDRPKRSHPVEFVLFIFGNSFELPLLDTSILGLYCLCLEYEGHRGKIPFCLDSSTDRKNIT